MPENIRRLPLRACHRGSPDSIIHNLTLATRNVSDFADTGISLVNPWAE
jgi:hypothetical protein